MDSRSPFQYTRPDGERNGAIGGNLGNRRLVLIVIVVAIVLAIAIVAIILLTRDSEQPGRDGDFVGSWARDTGYSADYYVDGTGYMIEDAITFDWAKNADTLILNMHYTYHGVEYHWDYMYDFPDPDTFTLRLVESPDTVLVFHRK